MFNHTFEILNYCGIGGSYAWYIYAIGTHMERKCKRCGTCKGCTSENCGKCSNCQDMPRYGGPGKNKLMLYHRKTRRYVS